MNAPSTSVTRRIQWCSTVLVFIGIGFGLLGAMPALMAAPGSMATFSVWKLSIASGSFAVAAILHVIYHFRARNNPELADTVNTYPSPLFNGAVCLLVALALVFVIKTGS